MRTSRAIIMPRCSSRTAARSVQIYRKLHLVPVRRICSGPAHRSVLARIVGDQVPADFAAGKSHGFQPDERQGVKVAPLICFEDTIGDLTRQFVLARRESARKRDE